FEDSTLLEKLSAEFKRSDVLGSSSDATITEDQSVFVETLPGILSTTLETPDVIGTYELIFTMQTKSGTYRTQSSPYKYYSSAPATVIDANTHRPIEGAHVKIYRYQESYGKYASLSQGIQNTELTDVNGYMNVTLPSGKYKFEVWGIGYPKVVTEYELGIKDFSYPVISMQYHFSLRSLVTSYTEAIKENTVKFCSHVVNFATSIRSLKASFTLLAFAEILVLLIFFINQGKEKRKVSFVHWLLHTTILNLMILIGLMGYFAALLFTLYLGIQFSFPFIILSILNSYLIMRILYHVWRDSLR
ncbi:MAG: carboxypeptidase-like regulatory domain-containing protein, partial [Patescibacteria group bacterium]